MKQLFEQFTTESRAIVRDAGQLADELGDRQIDTGHLLLALAGSGRDTAAVLARHGADAAAVRRELVGLTDEPAQGSDDRAALALLGIDLDTVRENIEASFGLGALERAALERTRGRGRRKGRFSADGRKCVELSLRAALHLHHRSIAGPHLMLAVLRCDGGRGRVVLDRLGVDRAAAGSCSIASVSTGPRCTTTSWRRSPAPPDRPAAASRLSRGSHPRRRPRARWPRPRRRSAG